MPIASGELEYTRFGFRDLIYQRAVDIIQPDITVCGGITEWLRIAKMAHSFNMPVAPHAWHDFHVHLIAATPNALTVEYFVKEMGIFSDTELYRDTIKPKNGLLTLPNNPGHGVELNEKVVEKYQVR